MCVWSGPSQLLRVDECGHPCTSTRHCCFTPPWPWLLTSPRPLLCHAPWDCGKGCDKDFSFVVSTSQSFVHMIYVIWSVLSCFIKCFPLHKETSLMRFESFTVDDPEATFLPWFGQLWYLADILTTCMFFSMAPYILIIFVASHFSTYAGGLFWRESSWWTNLPKVLLPSNSVPLSSLCAAVPCLVLTY